ncbi:CD206 [Mytilus edulis]|uniref:MRC n=1 Tax=Mytilus edulis TaxID=6550 RepID=A0A8S3RKS3_MYTED|nr:CD206 [Mytilus edulis]
MVFDDIKQGCTNQGASLAAVESQQKQFFFQRIFVGRSFERVCIAGEKQDDLLTWKLDDGTPLSYFNWAITDPDGGVVQRCLVLTADDTWFDTECIRNDPWTGRCPMGALFYRPLNFCYIVNQSNTAVFQEIKQDCNSKGGSLAVVGSQQKQSYFEHFLGTGRCPIGALLYRPLDFCYTVNTIDAMINDDIKQDCKNKGASLAVVDYPQKQSYFEHFLGDGRCPIGALLYRPLDFCYTSNTIRRARYGIIKQDCKNKGASLAAVESQQKQSYFELFLAERPYSRICIAGEEKVYNTWTLDDGTSLTYFNWYYDEPDHLDQKCLEIYINDEWFDIQCINNDPSERPYSRICIAGEEKVYNIWTLDDGTPLTYFNWYYIEPDHLDQKCLEIYINDEWFDIECINNDPCVYVCEIKSI